MSTGAGRTASDQRPYFVAKQVRAGDLEPDVRVWLELPAIQESEPLRACDAAAKRDAEAGEWKEGTQYGATAALKTKTPKKETKEVWT